VNTQHTSSIQKPFESHPVRIIKTCGSDKYRNDYKLLVKNLNTEIGVPRYFYIPLILELIHRDMRELRIINLEEPNPNYVSNDSDNSDISDYIKFWNKTCNAKLVHSL